MTTLVERLDDLQDLYGKEFAEQVCDLVAPLAPAPVATTAFDGRRRHQDGSLERAIQRHQLLHGDIGEAA
jgi:hypothetical protein